jgi:hypothetical protein
MLIDTREPPPEPPERPQPPQPPARESWWAADLRSLLLMVGGLVLVLVAGAFSPVVAYVLIVAACVLVGRGLSTFFRGQPGLKDFRQ